MSSESDFIASLTLAQTCLYKFGGPILMILGSVSSILSSIVFTKKNLRKNPCSIYFIAYNVVSFVFICTVILTQTLERGFHIDPALYSLPFCRFYLYTLLLADVVGPSYLILASVDRVLLTSRNARTRRRSTRVLAYAGITCVTMFWLLAVSHTLVLGRIMSVAPGVKLCYFQLDSYYTFVSYYSVLAKGIIIPLCMIILGLWAVRNIRSIGHVAPLSILEANPTIQGVSLRAIRSRDHQLLQILLVDVSLYLIFSSMLSVTLTYQQIIPDSRQSLAATQLRMFLMVVSSFSSHVPSCVTFYNNLLASKSFRKEAKQTFGWK